MKIHGGYDEQVSEMDSGTPEYWSPMMKPLSPEQRALTSSTYSTDFTYGHEDVVWRGSGYTIRGIFWTPPADAVYTIEVYGTFWSEALSGTVTTNYWASEFP